MVWLGARDAAIIAPIVASCTHSIQCKGRMEDIREGRRTEERKEKETGKVRGRDGR